MWIPPEERDPVVLQEPTRCHISVFGAVAIGTGRLVHQLSETFNATTFQDFLEKLLSFRKRDRILCLILDNSRYHHAKMLKPWLEKHKEELILEFLPPYSPQLNPIERVWKETRKKATHNKYFSTLSDLASAIEIQFESWSQPNTALARLCVIS